MEKTGAISRLVFATAFTAIVWPVFYLLVEGLRGTPLTVWRASPNNWIYLFLVIAAFCGSIFLLVRAVVMARGWRMIAGIWAFVMGCASSFGALINLWAVSCYGFYLGCI